MTFTAYQLEKQRVLTRIPRGNFIHVTAEDGKRVYMSLKDEMTLSKQVCPLMNVSVNVSTHLCLLKAQGIDETSTKFHLHESRLI